MLVPPRDAWELANPGLPYPIITAAPTEPQRTIDHASRAELTFAGAARSQSDLAERVPVEPEPAPEPDPVMQRAREMGYTPLPKRIRLVD